ncbi:MAG: CoA transferase [Planctomycetes bacterium]|nr:CoA transferase [Planctomycetota bacterium]
MSQTDSKNSHPLPLKGIRVLDLTRILAGPYCTMILADLGAEVVKIERPEIGDDARHFGPFLPSGLSGYFAGINRGKKSVTLDLKQDNDVQTFLKLVERADVLVENFRPGTMTSLGLDASRLQEINPKLVYASLSGFGHTGLETDRPAYDIVVQALSGLMSITGDGPGHFARVGTSISDILTGMFGAISILAALRHRDQTGQGSRLDLAMLDCVVAALENAVSRFSVTGEIPQPLGTRHPSITPFQAFETSDGPIVIAAGNDSLWEKLCSVLSSPELSDDPRLSTNALRTEHSDYLQECLNPRLQQQTQNQWLEKLHAAGIPAAPIRNIQEVVNDPHLAARNMLHEILDADGQKILTPGSPLHMNGHAPPLSNHAPLLGEHTQAVLDDWLSETTDNSAE